MKPFLLLAFTLSSSLAHAAGFSLSWSETQQAATATHFLQVIESTIPDKMKVSINRPLAIAFSSEKFSPISWDKCDDLTTYNRENLYRIQGSQIILNQDLAAALTEDSVSYRQSCLQEIDYNVANGAVYQAVAEIFDAGPDSVSKRKSFERQTNYVHSLFGGTHNKQRHDADSRKLYLDDEPRLLQGPSKAFTAEFENFEVNPQFYCAHPGMWNYLNMVLETNRPTPKCAKPFTSQLYDPARDGRTEVLLDPSNVYRVEFAYAHPGGKSLMGKLGHAMIRVVACSPAHPTPGPECENDLDYQYFLSFNSEGVSVLSGFTGKGVAQLFVVDYHLKLKEYIDQNRPVDTIPLKLSKQQLATLLGTAWDWNRRYRGRWNNITNNCVTESLDLLRASAPELDKVKFPYVTPGSLAHILQFRPLLSEGTRIRLDDGPATTSTDE